MNWLYIQAGDIEFKDDILEQLCNAKSSLWDASERRIARLINRLGLSVGLWSDASLWLDIVGKLRISSS